MRKTNQQPRGDLLILLFKKLLRSRKKSGTSNTTVTTMMTLHKKDDLPKSLKSKKVIFSTIVMPKPNVQA